MDCDIIKDLLPLYIDGVCSESTKKNVEEHLGQCSKCREIYEMMTEENETMDYQIDNMLEAQPFKKIKEKQKRKYGIIVTLFALILVGLLSFILVLYNTPDIRIGMTHSADGTVNFPSITCNARLGIGMSQKAEQKWAKALEEFRAECSDEVTYMMTHYTDLELDADITFEGDKTYIHLFGKGIPEGSAELENIDKNYELDFKAKPQNP